MAGHWSWQLKNGLERRRRRGGTAAKVAKSVAHLRPNRPRAKLHCDTGRERQAVQGGWRERASPISSAQRQRQRLEKVGRHLAGVGCST
jgi:hypothetical protein